MFLKKKHYLVIIFSSLIVGVVLVSTLIVYSLYTQWKEDILALRYRNSIYKLTAGLFGNEVLISNLGVKIAEDGVFAGSPVLEGTIKNSTGKTLTSVLMEMSYVRSDGTVVYKGWLHPLGEKRIGDFTMPSATTSAGRVMTPGESIDFQYSLRNCPEEVLEQITSRMNFAKNRSSEKAELVCSIVGLSVL